MVAIGVGTTFAIRALMERRRERSFTYRLGKALAPLREPPKPPFWQDALRKIALTAIGIVATELVKRGAHGLLAERRPVGLLAAHVEEK